MVTQLWNFHGSPSDTEQALREIIPFSVITENSQKWENKKKAVNR
jgi:septin family protein